MYKLPVWLSYVISKYTVHDHCLFSLPVSNQGNRSVIKATNLCCCFFFTAWACMVLCLQMFIGLLCSQYTLGVEFCVLCYEVKRQGGQREWAHLGMELYNIEWCLSTQQLMCSNTDNSSMGRRELLWEVHAENLVKSAGGGQWPLLCIQVRLAWWAM